MKIFSKISDIISADCSEMIDGVKAPEKILRQAICEIEAAIDFVEECNAERRSDRKRINQELENKRQQAVVWNMRARTAVADGSDKLARKAIAHKLDYQKLIPALEDEVLELDQLIQRFARQLNAMQTRLKEAKYHLAMIAANKTGSFEVEAELSKLKKKTN